MSMFREKNEKRYCFGAIRREMKKSLLIMAMVGLIIWFPLLADAGAGKKHGKQDKAFKNAIKKLQQQIDKIQLTLGPPGPQGEQGPQGVAGPIGPQGEQSPAGPQGEKGEQGLTGPAGADGADGAEGPQGPAGATGPAGPQGEQGATGECDCPITPEQLEDLYERIEFLENNAVTAVIARFTDMGDGTIRDDQTGLIWLKDASCSDLYGTDSNGKANWSDAKSAAAALAGGTCGLPDGSAAEDWRLPTEAELLAFMSTDYKDPAVVNTVGNAQWSEGDATRQAQ